MTELNKSTKEKMKKFFEEEIKPVEDSVAKTIDKYNKIFSSITAVDQRNLYYLAERLNQLQRNVYIMIQGREPEKDEKRPWQTEAEYRKLNKPEKVKGTRGRTPKPLNELTDKRYARKVAIKRGIDPSTI